MSKKILSARQLRKTFHYPVDVDILTECSLDVEAGESVAIIGASGEGKSTLLHILGSLEPATSGSLFIQGESVRSQNLEKLRNQTVGFVFQRFHLMEDLTALENILMPARIARRSVAKGSEAHQHALELLERVGLSSRADFQAKLLSGGERQRVAIARALINNPSLVLADEPSGNLDTASSEAIHRLLLSVVTPERALIVVTHDHDLASMCSRRLHLKSGTLHPIDTCATPSSTTWINN